MGVHDQPEYADITQAESLEDALFISIAKYGEINPTLVSQLLD